MDTQKIRKVVEILIGLGFLGVVGILLIFMWNQTGGITDQIASGTSGAATYSAHTLAGTPTTIPTFIALQRLFVNNLPTLLVILGGAFMLWQLYKTIKEGRDN